MATPKQTDPQFKLRLTSDLKDKIDADASANNRSMNAEIVARLEDSFLEAVRLPDDLKMRIEKSAKQNMRSLHAEVVQILVQYFPPEPTLDELLDQLESVLAFNKNRANPDYRHRLNFMLDEVRGRLERGEIPETMAMPVFSPEEVEKRKRGRKIAERMRRDRVAQQALISEAGPDIDLLLANGYLNYVDPNRKRRAKNLLESDDENNGNEAKLLLGLTSVKFPNEEEAKQVLYHALVADLSVD